MEAFVPRRLLFEHDRERVTVDAEDALTDPRLAGRPLILLGEAGSGKTELMHHWGGGMVATARQVTNGWCDNQGRSYVDGLDEAAGLKDGDALDRVLGALQAQSNNDFVLACRVADWRSASSVATIKSWTAVDAVELTIEPLGRDEVVAFLIDRAGLSDTDAETFFEHYEARGLHEWLGNPQTLSMLAVLANETKRPETNGELFAQYVDRSWQEHRKQSGDLASASKAEVLDSLGALFAALIIGGYDALTLAPGHQQDERDLPLSECKVLPGVASLPEGRVNAFLNSRLVTSVGGDRFTYQHRRIGEYLGSRWLAARGTTRELRTRLLGALRHNGWVPSNLRGLWGWLAEEAALASDVIGTDPLAVIDYGNADTLGTDAARTLLAAIEAAEDRHETFGWRDYRAASLVQPALAADVERVLAVPGEARFWTQLIVLRQMRDAETVERHQTALRAMMLDETRPYGARDAAADALADHGTLSDWPAIITKLANATSRESLRLALVMMLNPNVGLTLSDAEFAETAYAYSGLTPRYQSGREVGTVALYHLGRRQAIEDGRLDGMLDALADCANRYLTKGYNSDAWDVQRLYEALLERRIAHAPVDPEALWRWLRSGEDDHYSGNRESRERIDAWLKTNGDVRHALQRKVLDTCSEEPRSLQWRLRELAPGLLPDLQDTIALLNWLPAGDPRWRELIWFAPSAEGRPARDAAIRHVRTDDDRQLLANHANPPPLEWKEREAARQAKYMAEREARQSEQRADYLANRDRMRRGEYGALVGPAQVYMGRVYDVDSDPAPEVRIASWIGEDLQAEALVGFEAFLSAEPPNAPSATQIAESHASSRTWHAALIIVVALAERLRTGRGFADLSDERVLAGLLEMVAGLFNGEEWKQLRIALIDEVEHRGGWEEYARLLIEPQLKRRAIHPTGLWEILQHPRGTSLADEWLRTFPRMTAEPEEQLIDHLLRDGDKEAYATLAAVAKRRRKQSLDDRRRRNWEAVELILGQVPSARVTAVAVENRDFLWVLRNRLARRRRDKDRAIARVAGRHCRSLRAALSAYVDAVGRADRR